MKKIYFVNIDLISVHKEQYCISGTYFDLDEEQVTQNDIFLRINFYT